MGEDVKEHPIAMSAWSMQRILAGAKTQTRRVMRPQPELSDWRGASGLFVWHWRKGGENPSSSFYGSGGPTFCWNEAQTPHPSIAEYSPFGVPGDLLWVREPLVNIGGRVAREAGSSPLCLPSAEWPWKRDRLPAIFCPRWASRETLRVLSVRAERLMDITREDAIAEGVEPYDDGGYSPDDECCEVWRYLAVWDELNAKRGWAAEKNPWVWATEFEEAK